MVFSPIKLFSPIIIGLPKFEIFFVIIKMIETDYLTEICFINWNMSR